MSESEAEERISYRLLLDFVKQKAELKRRTLHLDDNSMERLTSLVAKPNKKSISAVKFGSLANDENTRKFATDDIVNTGILMICNHCEVSDVREPTMLPCLLVDSQVVSAALRRFQLIENQALQDDKDVEQFDLSDAFLKKNNLATLKEKVDLFGPATLADVVGLKFVTFVVNTDRYHWSLLVYDVEDNDITHYDSLGDMNQARALLLYRMLRNVSLIPESTVVKRLQIAGMQPGSWQCGFISIVYASFVGGTFHEIMNDDSLHVEDVVNDANNLVKFIAVLLERSYIAQELAKIVAWRFNHIYQQ